MEELDPRLVILGILLTISLVANIFFLLQPDPVPIQTPCISYIGDEFISMQGNLKTSTEKTITITVGKDETTFTLTNETRFYGLGSGRTFEDIPKPGEETNIPEEAWTPLPGETEIPQTEENQTAILPIAQYTQLTTLEELKLEPNELIKITYEEQGPEQTKIATEIMELE